ncbi:hypothetical protein ACQF36_29045 [Streptomyces sp. Marseille-Q5077]|uniref:hypothetical protein n=1 Tax=Streptomyces sp. Marseille-Q5077 TaxID=3418995 RepID=UPI003D0806CB
MVDQLTLPEMRLFAKETLKMLGEQQTDATEQRSAVQELAMELAARAAQPVTFGIVGEFSVGKSLLLGTLLGRSDLLPVENRKATGNITVLRLRQQPADGEEGRPQQTYADPTAEIHYLTHKRLGECVRTILDELADGLDHEHPELGAGAVLSTLDPLNSPEGWTLFDQWVGCLWPEQSHGRQGLLVDPLRIASTHRAAAAELCRIRDAWLSQDGVLGTVQRLPAKHLREALDHGVEERIPAARPLRRVQPFTQDEIRNDTEALSRSFDLIERVVQDVYVSREHWELNELLADHEVQFLDFPGIGGAGSYGRDTHLSRRELADVHTILVVLDARRAGTQGVESFWGMLTQDGRSTAVLGKAALVAASFFDQVPVPSVPETAVDTAELLQSSDELNAIHVHSDKFVHGREEAVVLTSAITAIHRYGLPYAALSSSSQARIDDAQRALDARDERGDSAGWIALADRFQSQDPLGHWADRLRAVADDGGVRKLHGLVEDHLRANGVALKEELAERSRRKLWDALRALQYQVRQEAGPTVATSAEFSELTERLSQYRALLTTLVAELDELRATVPQDVAATPPPLSLAGAAAEVRQAVYEWGEWDLLLQRARNDENGLVSRSAPPRPTGEFRKALPGRGATAPSTGVRSTDTTKGYITRFVALVKGHAERDRERLDTWLDAWQERWEAQFDELRSWFEEPGTLSLLNDVYLSHLGDPEEVENRLTQLWTALHPAEVVEDQRRQHDVDTGPREEPADRFPGLADHALPWHHAMPEGEFMTERQERHPLIVTQLRQYTADAAAVVVTERLNRLLSGRVDVLHTFYEKTAQWVLAEHDIRWPRGRVAGTRHASQSDDSADGPGDGPGHADDRGNQPIDVLMRTWRKA